MKISEIITEARSRVPARPESNPHPGSKNREDAWLYDGEKVNVWSAIQDILGNHVTTDDENIKSGMILVCPPWFGPGSGTFSNMDLPPGDGGCIGVQDIHSEKPSDIAEAVHESYHALLQLKGKNFENEHVVNRLAERWLQDNLSGMFLHQTLDALLKSKLSYRGVRYMSTREWRKKQEG